MLRYTFKIYIPQCTKKKKHTHTHTTKTHVHSLILYFESYGFKYGERIASKDVAARSDGL